MKVRGKNSLYKIVGYQGPSEQISYRNDPLGAPVTVPTAVANIFSVDAITMFSVSSSFLNEMNPILHSFSQSIIFLKAFVQCCW